MKAKTEKATFGAGCFWGVEAKFRSIKGVVDTKVGYMGGKKENPTYEDVCRDDTGHAEVCQVEFDPKKVSYEDLLKTFWNLHDPTQLNRQGPDVGAQYRSAVFYNSDAQKKSAEKLKLELEKFRQLKGKIMTEIVPAGKFYMAEEYHQKYLEKRGMATCHI